MFGESEQSGQMESIRKCTQKLKFDFGLNLFGSVLDTTSEMLGSS
jgi:hypothetical protein